MNKVKYIAIIAFDNKKTELIEWSYFNKTLLMPHKILALGCADNILEGTLNKKVNIPESGKMGEYKELYNLISNEQVDAVVIFSDAEKILNNKDLVAINEAAIKHNIIIATNKTTADFILHSTLLDIEYTINKDEKKITDTLQSGGAGIGQSLAKAS